MTAEVRACVFCTHALFEEPYAYESCSGGDVWTCIKGHFPYHDKSTISMIDEETYNLALNCKDFALSQKFKR